jgi:hypothetical protein
LPYKNKKDLTKYQRDWVWRKRAGLKTRVKPTLTEKLTKKELEERRRKTKRDAYDRKRVFIESHVGDTCDICGANARNIHRKDGHKHVTFYKMPWSELSETFVGDGRKYANLCQRHHKIVHHFMDEHKMNWNDAFLLLKRMSSNNRKRVEAGFIAP